MRQAVEDFVSRDLGGMLDIGCSDPFVVLEAGVVSTFHPDIMGVHAVT